MLTKAEYLELKAKQIRFTNILLLIMIALLTVVFLLSIQGKIQKDRIELKQELQVDSLKQTLENQREQLKLLHKNCK